MTLQIQSCLFASGAMREWYVIVRNIVEEVDFFLVQKDSSSNGMDRSIAPTFIEESSILVKRFKVVDISFGSKPVEVTDLKVRPLNIYVSAYPTISARGSYHVAVVVCLTTIITEEAHRVVLGNVLRVRLHEFPGAFPQCWDGLHVFVETQYEAVLLFVLLHEPENVVVDVAVQLNAWLDAPVVFVVQHDLLTEEEARLESAHVTVADRVSVDNLPLSHVLADLASLVLVNVLWE